MRSSTHNRSSAVRSERGSERTRFGANAVRSERSEREPRRSERGGTTREPDEVSENREEASGEGRPASQTK
ncbi:hypothetical protein EA472_10770 [Natrarchaeobius oligotrophus]|uniref:Uncharacterized protein n=1 Tax=Natrarchaeobius chitinivorans TaxID=1679083 RepID=A0A3N6MCE2_NATCH|nr:hypothetical protein EA472_10770 [Natrarchaeobius chitinivorans]